MVNGSGRKNLNRNRIKVTGISTRRLYQNIILIHMIHEQKNFDADKPLDLWRERQSFHTPKWKDQSYLSLPKTARQLFHVIQNSGYPGISKKTLYECLNELVDLHVLMRFTRTGTDKQFNRIFYAIPWGIKFGDDFQYRHYYIPWKLSVPQKTMDALRQLSSPLGSRKSFLSPIANTQNIPGPNQNDAPVSPD